MKLYINTKYLAMISAFIVLITLTGCSKASIQDNKNVIEIQHKKSLQATINPEPDEIEPLYPHELSLESFQTYPYTGSDFEFGNVLANTQWYTRYTIFYQADGLRLSGIMNVPKGDGPFPVLILNHGYIDPAIYTNGRGLKREQDFFARNGYTVIHPDYRNHAFSDKDPNNDRYFRIGYVKDVIGVILAIQSLEDERFDTDRIGMLGHSMGGGITMKVAVIRPDLIQAAVLYGPMSADERDNFLKWTVPRVETAAYIEAAFGSIENNPKFWDGISAISYFDQLDVPILIQQGENDASTPKEWAQRIYDTLSDNRKDVQIDIYPAERHEFGPYWSDFMWRSKEFFDEKV